MNIKSLINLLTEEINKTGYKCYSPDLPQNDKECVVFQISPGTNQGAINKNILYSDIPFYLLIRGTNDDEYTSGIADTIFNRLHHKENVENDDLRIILISCSTPNYAFRDENQRIHYNINSTVKVEWKEEN